MAIPFAELNKINPSSIIELYELELTVGKHITSGNPLNLPTVYRFHSGANLNNFGEIIYRENSYQRVAVKAQGFGKQSQGVVNRPKLIFSNLGGIVQNPAANQIITMSDFLISVNAVTPNNDLIDAKFTRKLPLASSLDDANFITPTNPFNTANTSVGLDDRLKDEIYIIDRKSLENRVTVEFDLVAANDIENKLIPLRVVTRDIFPAVGGFV